MNKRPGEDRRVVSEGGGERSQSASSVSKATHPKRSLSLPLITLYGLGTTIGAGIYILVLELQRLLGT